jgi:hypothetical protein
MMRRYRSFILAALVGVVAASAVARSIRSGETALAAGRSDSVKLSFELAHAPDGSSASGRLECVDRGAGVRFGGVTDPAPVIPGGEGPRIREFAGDYAPLAGVDDPGGRFNAFLFDRGTPGPSKEDLVEVRLSGGLYDGYYTVRPLDGARVPERD